MDHLQEILDEILVAIKDLVRCTELKGGKREITVPPVPDVVPYGNWDQANINGIWGTGSTARKCSFLGFVKNGGQRSTTNSPPGCLKTQGTATIGRRGTWSRSGTESPLRNPSKPTLR